MLESVTEMEFKLFDTSDDPAVFFPLLSPSGKHHPPSAEQMIVAPLAADDVILDFETSLPHCFDDIILYVFFEDFGGTGSKTHRETCTHDA